jgi:hypothetical protein
MKWLIIISMILIINECYSAGVIIIQDPEVQIEKRLPIKKCKCDSVVKIVKIEEMPLQVQSSQEGEVWKEIWPSEADSFGEIITDSRGREYPTTGQNAASWFNWGGLGSWKVFEVTPNVPIYIRISGDSCPGCCLGTLKFKLYEEENNEWKEKFVFNGPSWSGEKPENEIGYRFIYYTPTSKRIKIQTIAGGFYLSIYKEVLNDEKIKPDEKIIRKDELYAQLNPLVTQLLNNLEEENFKDDSEYRQNLHLLGIPVIEVLGEQYKIQENNRKRLEIISILKNFKNKKTIPYFISALSDKDEDIKKVAYEYLKTISGKEFKIDEIEKWKEWGKSMK